MNGVSIRPSKRTANRTLRIFAIIASAAAISPHSAVGDNHGGAADANEGRGFELAWRFPLKFRKRGSE